jgi:hypothetical protein
MRLKPLSAASALALFAGTSIAMAQSGGPAQQPEATQQERHKGAPSQPPRPGRQSDTQAGERRGQAQQKEDVQSNQHRGQAQQRQEAETKEQRERTQQRQEAETKEQRQRAQQKREAQTKEQRERTQQNQEAQSKEQRSTKEAQPGQQSEQAGRVQLTEQQRMTVRERIRQGGLVEQARVNNVDFNIAVGARVPRERVRLVPLPLVIVEDVPAWRGYSFFVVRDRMVIVEPETYAIVSVVELDHGPARAAGGVQRLSLTNEQRQLVLRSVEMRPSARLGIGDVTPGMDVPRNIELRDFPQVVVREIPELRPYRYFVFEQEVAIVDPRGRTVVEVISE